ncbi:MAG: hypothetical protein DRH57_04715 [Candidatus Cloacimonadota bacterium]|nr:MAG: hypothetical protein DRH57_04715 [Candidatus Cloacimonadota bacterium]
MNINIKWLFIISIVLLLFFTSCDSTKPDNNGSLSGKILLDGETDHSGITVGVYKLAELNPDIVEINRKYSQIGVIINQHTEFDHRTGTLVKQTSTNADGNFKISDIPNGKYNVVAIKDSFGFKYIYNVSIAKGDNSLPESHTLYRETYITSDINADTTWLADHHYIIGEEHQTISVINNAVLTIEPGAVVRLNKNVSLSIGSDCEQGNLTAIGENSNMIWFTKNDGITENLNEIILNDDYQWDGIYLTENANAEVEWCKFDYSSNGLQNKIDGFSISNSIFNNCIIGFLSSSSTHTDSTHTDCSNLLCRNIDSPAEGGIFFEMVNTGTIEKNIFYNCYYGLKVKDGFKGEIKNNYFKNNNNGAWLMKVTVEFTHNELYNNSECDIRTSGATSPKITYNEINSNNGILIECDVGYQDSSPLIHKNNFYNEDWFIYVKTHNRIDIDAKENYFDGLNNVEDIKQKVYDKEDYPANQQYDIGDVDVSNFRTYKYDDAGITGD